MTVRAFWKATKVRNAQPPYDTIQFKVFYPASTSSISQKETPFPVVIFFSGINCNLAMYEWLALELAASRLVVVLFNFLQNTNFGSISLTPGVDTTAFSPDFYGNVPSALALPSLLAELEQLNTSGLLSGFLDLQKIILGGHSAGGRIALENAHTQFFSQVVAAFSYGAHTAASVGLGYEPGTILSLPDSVPMLLIAGTQDGVIAKNSKNYGIPEWDTPATPVIRTFKEAISREQGDSYLVVLEEANHFSIADRPDVTLEVTALDFPSNQPPAKIRSVISLLISLFIEVHVCQNLKAFEQFQELLQDRNCPISFFECK